MERRCCAECGKPIMIMSSAFKTELNSLEVNHVMDFGCLNKDCERCGVIVGQVINPANEQIKE